MTARFANRLSHKFISSESKCCVAALLCGDSGWRRVIPFVSAHGYSASHPFVVLVCLDSVYRISFDFSERPRYFNKSNMFVLAERVRDVNSITSSFASYFFRFSIFHCHLMCILARMIDPVIPVLVRLVCTPSYCFII